jgi:hypothetical protein
MMHLSGSRTSPLLSLFLKAGVPHPAALAHFLAKDAKSTEEFVVGPGPRLNTR